MAVFPSSSRRQFLAASVAAVAVPLVIPGSAPAALAVLYFPREVDVTHIADVLAAAAARIATAVA